MIQGRIKEYFGSFLFHFNSYRQCKRGTCHRNDSEISLPSAHPSGFQGNSEDSVFLLEFILCLRHDGFVQAWLMWSYFFYIFLMFVNNFLLLCLQWRISVFSFILKEGLQRFTTSLAPRKYPWSSFFWSSHTLYWWLIANCPVHYVWRANLVSVP